MSKTPLMDKTPESVDQIKNRCEICHGRKAERGLSFECGFEDEQREMEVCIPCLNAFRLGYQAANPYYSKIDWDERLEDDSNG